MHDDTSLAPIRFDNTPRYIESSITYELSESALYHGLMALRPLAQARGFNSRALELSDVILVCSEVYVKRCDEFKKKFPMLRIQQVTPSLLRTPYSWGLVYGVDVYINTPN